MSDEDPLDDEILSINAICGDDTLIKLDDEARICALKLPSSTGIIIRIQFPQGYPEIPPTILGTESVGEDVAKGAGGLAVALARRILGQVFIAGEPCIFTLLEELREQWTESQSEAATSHSDQGDNDELVQKSLQTSKFAPIPSWTIAPPLTEKKSVFVGRSASVESPEQAKTFLQHFLSTDKKAAKAKHNIVVWRIQGTEGASYQDCNDDGETAAGGRLLHLMQLMNVWNVMVVVTRWYGGTHLGPDRFRIINNAARSALELAGFVKDGGKRTK